MLILAIFHVVKTLPICVIDQAWCWILTKLFFAFSRTVFASNATEISPHPTRFAISPLPDNKVRMSDIENEMDARFEV